MSATSVVLLRDIEQAKLPYSLTGPGNFMYHSDFSSYVHVNERLSGAFWIRGVHLISLQHLAKLRMPVALSYDPGGSFIKETWGIIHLIIYTVYFVINETSKDKKFEKKGGVRESATKLLIMFDMILANEIRSHLHNLCVYGVLVVKLACKTKHEDEDAHIYLTNVFSTMGGHHELLEGPWHFNLTKNYIVVLSVKHSATENLSMMSLLVDLVRPYLIQVSAKTEPGSWVGPYAMCRTWETLAHAKRKESVNEELTSLITIFVVSGDDNGERGGAPVVCVEDITRHGFEFSKGQGDWVSIVLLVPLVLGLDKVNPRYLPLLEATFSFPQSLGILGGKPGASTYIIGVQDDKAFYLDPHDVQQVVDISKDDLGADTSTYHSNTVRNLPLESLDPSLAIGFYCKDKCDFDDFCIRASELAEQSNGAPLFTVTETRNSYKDDVRNDTAFLEPDSFEVLGSGEKDGCTQEDDWQLL